MCIKKSKLLLKLRRQRKYSFPCYEPDVLVKDKAVASKKYLVLKSDEVKTQGNGSWLNVAQSTPKLALNFESFPLEGEIGVVNPPDEELLLGNKKFQNCMVGTFYKKAPPLNFDKFTNDLCGKRGFGSVSQKSSSTFFNEIYRC